jgi:hypothetical protein
MKRIIATTLRRKIEGVGNPSFVREREAASADASFLPNPQARVFRWS